MNPSNFTKFPYNSVKESCEAETVAQNIMIILKRTGDNFRPLSWDEYKKERLKDRGFLDAEERYFKDVIDFCKSPDTAKLFSKVWAEK